MGHINNIQTPTLTSDPTSTMCVTFHNLRQFWITKAEAQAILEAKEAPKPGLINTAKCPNGFRHDPWPQRPDALVCNSLTAAREVLANLGNKSGQDRQALTAKAESHFAEGYVVVILLDSFGNIIDMEYNLSYCANGTRDGL